MNEWCLSDVSHENRLDSLLSFTADSRQDNILSISITVAQYRDEMHMLYTYVQIFICLDLVETWNSHSQFTILLSYKYSIVNNKYSQYI